MKRGPKIGAAGAVDFLAKARAAWGDPTPPEILALAQACAERTAKAVAHELRVSPALISNLIARKYPGDVPLALAKIRGALLGETVNCPVLGDIGRDRCLAEQKRPFATSNPMRVHLHRACPRCPNRRDA